MFKKLIIALLVLGVTTSAWAAGKGTNFHNVDLNQTLNYIFNQQADFAVLNFDSLKDDSILSEDFADEDWGDVSVSTNSVTLDSGVVDSTAISEEIIQYATVEISNSEIKALAATPKVLVVAPGADKLIELISATLILDYGSEVLAEPSAPDDLALEYDNGLGTQIATWDTTGFITAGADTMEIVTGANIAAVATATNVNKNLVLINTGGEYTGNATNDTTVTVKVVYRIHTMGL